MKQQRNVTEEEEDTSNVEYWFVSWFSAAVSIEVLCGRILTLETYFVARHLFTCKTPPLKETAFSLHFKARWGENNKQV